jgi:hypothetical protein
MSMPTAPRINPIRIEARVLTASAAEAHEGAKRQELNAEELRRAKVQGKLGNERRKKRSPG